MKLFFRFGLVIYLATYLSCTAQSRVVATEATLEQSETLAYYLYYPAAYEQQPDQKFGLLLFLHGGGDSGGDLESLKSGGPPKLIAEGMEFPFLILAPQHPYPKQWWNTRAVKQLLEKVVEENRVDPHRLYLTGLSRGGGAAWEMAVNYPETFAALAVVCGMSPLPYANWIDKELPIWVFHGTDDPVIPFSESESMVRRLEALGHAIKFTTYDGAGHAIWEEAYTQPELYDWFNAQKRAKD